MALASLGALLAMCVTAAINWRLQRDFAAEWAGSLRIRDVGPTGEAALAAMLKQRPKRRRRR
jgi:putative membrane protein